MAIFSGMHAFHRLKWILNVSRRHRYTSQEVCRAFVDNLVSLNSKRYALSPPNPQPLGFSVLKP